MRRVRKPKNCFPCRVPFVRRNPPAAAQYGSCREAPARIQGNAMEPVVEAIAGSLAIGATWHLLCATALTAWAEFLLDLCEQ